MNFAGNFIKLGDHDVSRFAEKIKDIRDEVWNVDSSRQIKFAVHEHTRTLKFLMDDDFRHTRPTVQPLFREYIDVVEPVLKQIHDLFSSFDYAKKLVAEGHRPGYFVRIILVKLLAHGCIPSHFDEYESLKRSHRVHLPVISNDKVVFTVGNIAKVLKAGEIWEVNNRENHFVNNDGDEDRIHLILDYVQPGEKVIDYDGKKLVC